MLVPNRNFQSPAYRYGFQGQEKDDEVKGNGNSLNYKFRMHDPRIGRFFAVDPLALMYQWNSPYAFAENKVIKYSELEGAEIWDKKWWQDYGNSFLGVFINTKDMAVDVATTYHGSPIYDKLLGTWIFKTKTAQAMKKDPVAVVVKMGELAEGITVPGMIKDYLSEDGGKRQGEIGGNGALFMATEGAGVIVSEIKGFSSGVQGAVDAGVTGGISEYTAVSVIEESSIGISEIRITIAATPEADLVMTATELEARGSIQAALGTSKGVYKFTFKNGDVYIGQAKGIKGFAQRVKTSLRENVTGIGGKAPKAGIGAELDFVEFFKPVNETKGAINSLEAEIIEKSGGLEARNVINVKNAPTTK